MSSRCGRINYWAIPSRRHSFSEVLRWVGCETRSSVHLLFSLFLSLFLYISYVYVRLYTWRCTFCIEVDASAWWNRCGRWRWWMNAERERTYRRDCLCITYSTHACIFVVNREKERKRSEQTLNWRSFALKLLSLADLSSWRKSEREKKKRKKERQEEEEHEKKDRCLRFWLSELLL